MSRPDVGADAARPLADLSERLLQPGAEAPPALLEALEADNRAGARALARKLRARAKSREAEAKRLAALLRFEEVLWAQGFTRIAGVDEAGVGPCAGPVVAGAVILPARYQLEGLDDSKKVLDPARREALAACIKADAVAWAVGFSEVEEIDEVNIYQASLRAMRRAVVGLAVAPDYCLVDARRIPELATPQKGIVRGDSLSASIAAASILAKTTRDAHMAELDRRYPGWGLAVHKGYPTPDHLARLAEQRPSPAHRTSFGPVRDALARASGRNP